MSGIIIYRTSYGSTKQYAEWIHEETGYPMFESRDKAIPWDADTIVIGCPIIANKPFLLGWMQKQWCHLKDKRVVLFTTSGANPAVEPVKDWVEKSLPAEMKGKMALFPLAGRFNYADMGGAHKAMLKIGAAVLQSDEIKHQIKNPVDGVKREHLAPLLAFLKSKPR